MGTIFLALSVLFRRYTPDTATGGSGYSAGALGHGHTHTHYPSPRLGKFELEVELGA